MNELHELGRSDCEQGLPVKTGMSDAYYEGYSQQYAIEQQQSQGEYN